MASLKEAEKLISSEKYAKAAAMLDTLLAKRKKSDRLWYLRGIAALRQKDYDAAHRYFNRAAALKKRPEYYRIMGMAHMELFEVEEAVKDFELVLALSRNDALAHFFLAVCYMFLDHPKSGHHLKRAYSIDRKKTKQMINNFYRFYFREDPRIDKSLRKRLERTIKNM